MEMETGPCCPGGGEVGLVGAERVTVRGEGERSGTQQEMNSFEKQENLSFR